MVEHFYVAETERLLREGQRALNSRGTLRVNLPRLAEIVARLSEGDTEAALGVPFARSRDDREGWQEAAALG